MKRPRDDGVSGADGGIQLKSPSISESSKRPKIVGRGSAHELTNSDVVAYYKNVKDKFLDKKEKYKEFYDVLNDYKDQRIDITGVVARVKELFRGHRELILGFNAFIPKEYEIVLSQEDTPTEPSRRPQIMGGGSQHELINSDAVAYLKNVKDVFLDNKEKYKQFLDVCRDLKYQRIDATGAIARIKELLRGHRELILGFNTFLPKEYKIVLSPEDTLTEPSRRPQIMGGGSQHELINSDAVAYLKNVKDVFLDNKEKYKEFVDILRDYKDQRINTTLVVERLKGLFRGQQELLLGFNAFLPKGCKIVLSQEYELNAKKAAEFEDAMKFVEKIRMRFQGDNHMYRSFVDILHKFRKETKSVTEVHQQVAVLFHNQLDLLNEFTNYLPDSLAAAAACSHYHHSSGTHKPRFGDRSLPIGTKLPLHSGNKELACQADCDVTTDCDATFDMAHSYQNKDHEIHCEKEKVRKEDGELKHSQDIDFDNHGMNSVAHKHKSANTLEDDDKDRARDASADMLDPNQDNDHKTHDEKEKVRKEDGEQHSQDKDFDNHGINSIAHKHISAYTLEDDDHDCDAVADMAGSYQDEDFANHGMRSVVHKIKSANTLEDAVKKLFHIEMRELVISLLEKVKERLQSSDDYQEFLKCIMRYLTENITRSQLKSLVHDLLEAYPDLIEEVNELIDCDERYGSLRSEHIPGSLKSKDQDRDKNHDRCETRNLEYQAKPVHELDLSDCEQCTPSYRRLPKNYPIPSASQRTIIDAGLLNDQWVSVASSSEDYSSKHMRKNRYEEKLFKCEDDRFELDMLLEIVNVTIRRAEELLDKINNNLIKTVRVEDHFTPLNLRCIGRLYGDNRLDVIDVVRKNASLALPVILTRLKQKQEDWACCRLGFNKVWAEIYAKNFHKSLDHRSFYR